MVRSSQCVTSAPEYAQHTIMANTNPNSQCSSRGFTCSNSPPTDWNYTHTNKHTLWEVITQSVIANYFDLYSDPSCNVLWVPSFPSLDHYVCCSLQIAWPLPAPDLEFWSYQCLLLAVCLTSPCPWPWTLFRYMDLFAWIADRATPASVFASLSLRGWVWDTWYNASVGLITIQNWQLFIWILYKEIITIQHIVFYIP